MYLLIQCVLMFSVIASVNADEIFIPEQFRKGQPIEQVVLILDVDGVIRESVDDTADPRIIEAIKSLLKNQNVDVAFISGTPVENDPTLEPWCRGNVSLNKVFGSSFEQELLEDKVAIYGVLGGHRMKNDGTLEILDEYSPEISYELSKLFIYAFLKEVLQNGNSQQQRIAQTLYSEVDSLKDTKPNPSTNATPKEFHSIAETIRHHLDPHFRLISNGALIETHTSHPLWNTSLSFKWMQEEINKDQYFISNLPPWQKQMATGFGKKGNEGFNYLLISKTNKGLTAKKHIQEKLKRYPKAFIITVGDTQVDFPMHAHAHLAFHVGLEKVWIHHCLPQCMMIRGEKGEESQHVKGTLKVLQLLSEAIGKSFYDFKYIPKYDDFGKLDYYSISEVFN